MGLGGVPTESAGLSAGRGRGRVAGEGEVRGGITFQFASFDNKLIMPNWVMPPMDFAVHFDDAHSGAD